MLAGEDDEHFWQTRLQRVQTPLPQGTDSLLLKVSVLPTDVARWIERLAALAAEMRLAAAYAAQVGHGIVFVRLAGDAEALVGASSRCARRRVPCRSRAASSSGMRRQS